VRFVLGFTKKVKNGIRITEQKSDQLTVFDISRFPDVPRDLILRVKEVFTYVMIGAELEGGKVSYSYVWGLLRDKMTAAEFRAAFENLYNLGVIREEECSLAEEPEDLMPGQWAIETVEVAPFMESEFVIEIYGIRDRQ
jgi:hypothetical protein